MVIVTFLIIFMINCSDVQNNSMRLESAFRRDRMSDFSSTDSSVCGFPTFEYEQALSRKSDFRQPIHMCRFPAFEYEQLLSRMSDFRQPTQT